MLEILCTECNGLNGMSVKDVEYYFDLQHLQHALIYTEWLKSPKSQLSQNFSQIENQMNIKQVISKTHVCIYFWASFDTFNMHSLWSIILNT